MSQDLDGARPRRAEHATRRLAATPTSVKPRPFGQPPAPAAKPDTIRSARQSSDLAARADGRLRRVDGTIIEPVRGRRTPRHVEVLRDESPMPEPVPDALAAAHHGTSTRRRAAADLASLSEKRIEPDSEPFLEMPDVCPICKGAGFVRLDVPYGHPSFGRAIMCTCKERVLEERRRESLWKLSNLDAFQEMTFETFNPRVAGTREAWEIARRYADDMTGWLLFSGTYGCGKTHLAAAIANVRFQQGWLVLFTIVPKLLDHLRAAFSPQSETAYDALFEKVCEAGLLVLDDLGAEHSTSWAQEKLFQIINHRSMYHLPTVITTNVDFRELDPRVASRLSDIGLVRRVHITADDYRPHHVPSRGSGRSQRG
jgi:DNA replication protein DnaC